MISIVSFVNVFYFLILIIKVSEMHYFSNLSLIKNYYMFRTDLLSIIGSLNSSILTLLADSRHNRHDKYLLLLIYC